MLLRNTISSTKKFFNKTFQSFKSLLKTGSGDGSSGHYQKLPKSSATYNNNFSTYGRVVAAEDHLIINNKMEKEPSMKDQESYNEGFKKFTQQIIISPIQNRGLDDDNDDDDDGILERNREFVKEKLKEMVLMDLINVEHVKDIEEVLYYYSHITCPVYVEIVNKFFMEMYSGFFIHQQTSVTDSRRI